MSEYSRASCGTILLQYAIHYGTIVLTMRFPQLHQNYALEKFLPVGNECRIPCHFLQLPWIGTRRDFHTTIETRGDNCQHSLCVPIKTHAMHNNMATAADHNLTPFSMINLACYKYSCKNMYGLIRTLPDCYNLW